METIGLNPWKIDRKEKIYDNAWITVTHHDVTNSSGSKGVYGVVHFKNLALGILVLDEFNNTWLVGQYRFPLNAYTWEIPEGGGQIGIDPLISAQRELEEETGIIASDWQLIQEMQLSNSATDELAFLYLARGLRFKEANPDDGEELEVRKLPFEEAYQLVLDGKIADSLSVAAILKVKLLFLEGKL